MRNINNFRLAAVIPVKIKIKEHVNCTDWIIVRLTFVMQNFDNSLLLIPIVPVRKTHKGGNYHIGHTSFQYCLDDCSPLFLS